MAWLRDIKEVAYFLKSIDDERELTIFEESIDNTNQILRGEFRSNHFGLTYLEDNFLAVYMFDSKDALDDFVDYFLRPVMYGEAPHFYYDAGSSNLAGSAIHSYEWELVKADERKEAIISSKNIKIKSFEDLRTKNKIKTKE